MSATGAVTMADLDEAWQQNDAASRIRMLGELYDTRRRTLDIVIGEILVETRGDRARHLARRVAGRGAAVENAAGHR